jgi:hypothetical protein
MQSVDVTLPTGELEPGGQEVGLALLVLQYFPASQLVHPCDPAAVLYFPGEHSTHEPPSGPVKPMSQMQSVDVTLPTGELEPGGQEVGAVAPVVSQ